MTIALAAVGLSIAGAGYFMWSFMDDFGACETVEHHSIPSPDGQSRIVVFSRECNATVPLNTQFSISPMTGRFSPERNPPFLVARSHSNVTAAWQSNDVVEVDLPGDAAIDRQERSAGQVRIHYR